MKRLFVSLYLLLSLSFLGIGWTLDSIWQHYIDNGASENAPLVAFAQLLSQLPEDKRASYLKKMTHTPDFPLTLLDANQVALADKHQLTNDAVISIATTPTTELHFVAVGDQILMAGPLDLDPNAKLRGLFNLFFYLSLALVSLIWVWPLSRDLKTLQSAAKQLGIAKWDTQIVLSTRSQVHELAQTFNDMASHIAHLIDNQTHLLNAVSHEIRTPLSRLKFALALMSQYARSHIPNQSQLSDNINQDIDEIEALLEELLSYTSLDPQYDRPKFEHCELNLLVEKTIKRLQIHQIIPITFIPLATQIEIKANALLIDRALQNLITNALRFSQQSIIVEISCNKKWIQISVIDDGEGISSAEQDKIFEPFYRSNNKHKNETRGHGLGLAIVKRIMEKHHGSATLESHHGQTKFSLNLPLNLPRPID
ncbi:HAMP domain-containing sensor histidine kinase [Shewanella surugensis]|uniref:histidine kinase n=1 Tax=Shewanella surugensis TaxID=212020 RepID=A0ABT0LGM9_9GAMM|nr:ATP-binding protein [Shewanella surugensis]MCL1126853.1 ATP-binding protein [Shewanella surugensis]